MNNLNKHNKKFAAVLMVVMLLEQFTPLTVYALTSGPSQPETQNFAAVGSSDMVDLFSGKFSYNVPLLDVGGYPVNLAYHSDGSIDEESSWCGYSWNINVGSLNRQLRGIPDEFNGTDMQEREMNTKDHVTTGVSMSTSLDLLGFPVSKVNKNKKKKKVNLSLTVSAGVKTDNYRGIGVELGSNVGAALTEAVAGEFTASGKDSAVGKSLGLGSIGLNLSSMDGAGVSLNMTILRKSYDQNDKTHSMSKSIGFGYNSRAGLTGMTLTTSRNGTEKSENKIDTRTLYDNSSSSSISFNGDSYTPTIDHGTNNTSFTLSLNAGPEIFFAYLGFGLTGYYSRQTLSQRRRITPAYGYLNSEKGKDLNSVLMDFNREKDIPYNEQIKHLPIPIPTYDLFTASSQDGGGQYHLYRGGSGVFFDQKTTNTSIASTLGLEGGGGAYFDIGADLYFQGILTETQKWRSRNNYLPKGDFQKQNAGNPLYESAYFKRVGEPVPSDKGYIARIKGTAAMAVNISPKSLNPLDGAEASSSLRTRASVNGENTTVLRRDKREVRNTNFSYLTAKEASLHGLDKTIKDYNPDSLTLNNCNTGGIRNNFPRVGGYRKQHHFSEITITGDDGKRSVYGIPVYNTYQEEVSFSVSADNTLRRKGLIGYTDGTDNSLSNKKGLENYFSREKTPSYATSYLLTGILSPDYVDVTGNGITDDDMGTAVKFNYSRQQNLYSWRTPYAFGKDTANYNEGFLSDTKDDKANYVFGQKELWYLHSIESKTMVAYFILGNRNDGLGVLDSRGEVDTTNKLQYLKEIRLYSKSDLQLNGNNPSITNPIKTVHLEYDYTICRGLPNSIGNQGKLTLKKVYFTFGRNQKGRLNPYEFVYDTSYNHYDYRQYDRWGSFKNAADNLGGLNNSEYPYTLQDTSLTNKYIRAGQLTQILLPSGGRITVNYESGDYAFVQDKRASQMFSFQGVGTAGSASGLTNADYIYINLPASVSTQSEMLERYFEGIENLYYKCFLDLDGLNHEEFVPGYAQIVGKPELVGNNIAKIRLAKVKNINPITKAGWQLLRMSLPKYAYPGSDNLDENGSNLKKIITALLTALTNFKELVTGFEGRAARKDYSDKLNLSKSWVRLCSPGWKKLGGGSRVSRIDISDEWADMSQADNAKTAKYSTVYDYTTKDAKGRTISSGVASYEPLIGNDENPLRQPIRYKQKEFLGLDNNYYIEEPLGESFFPSANVGYSKVTVKAIGSGDDISVNRTGTVTSEFYTAKDYPVILSDAGFQDRRTGTSKVGALIGGVSITSLGLSHGYSVELNDMHGKPKSVNTFNKSGQKISSIEYFYQSDNELAERRKLRNDVKVINAEATVSNGMIGLDVEAFTDMRQQTTNNLGVSAKASGGSGAFLFFPLPFFFPGIGINYDQRCYRSSSTIKIVQRFGIQYKVRKMENGSSITSENLLWDAETGNVLLTKTQNEFDDPVYSFVYPAHWVYNGMGQAYHNLGTVFSGFSTNSNGEVINSVYSQALVAGDELIDVNSGNKYWVINTPMSSVYHKRLIDAAGNIQQVSGLTIKVLRSGRRNMANIGIATISSLVSPIAGDRLDISGLTKVLDAQASVFNEEWSMPVSSKPYEGTSGQSCVDPSCLATFFKAAIGTQVPNESRKNLFAAQEDLQTAGSVIKSYISQGGGLLYGSCFNNMWNGFPADSLSYYMHTQRFITVGCTKLNQVFTGDTLTLGNCLIVFDYVNNSTASISDYNNYMDIKPAGYNPCYDPYCTREGFRLDNDSCGFTIKKVKVVTPPMGGCRYDSTLYSIFSVHAICSPVNVTGCQSPVGSIFNPYFTGMLGNWRLQSQHAYHVSREQVKDNPALLGNTNIRRSGSFSSFNPFWQYNYTYNGWVKNPANDSRWIAANEVTNFNSKGMEVENKDALNRYSSALFGYRESLPMAVASNARYREIGYDGFEDYGFQVDCSAQDPCSNAHFNFQNLLNGTTIKRTDQQAHTGRYSLELGVNTGIQKTVFLGESGPLYSFSSGKYILKSNELAKGFSPIPGKRYVLSFWVKDGSPRDASTNVQVSINGVSILSNASKWPVVEGWKRIEQSFTLPGDATGFDLQMNPGETPVFIDDIRIFPFDGQLKSFAYDPSSQRLWAELDENNFATFYEYDDEGILVRVKKETERGIMTIKETRSSYRKKQ